MIEAVVVFKGHIDGGFISSIVRRDTMLELNKVLSLYFKNREVKNIYITIRGEENEKN